jgi:hypothetical protein
MALVAPLIWTVVRVGVGGGLLLLCAGSDPAVNVILCQTVSTWQGIDVINIMTLTNLGGKNCGNPLLANVL